MAQASLSTAARSHLLPVSRRRWTGMSECREAHGCARAAVHPSLWLIAPGIPASRDVPTSL